MNVAITQTTHGKLPRLPFEHIKDEILGKKYDLSIVFAGDHRMRNLNFKYRKKTYVPNVLSFPLEKDEGEIFINPNRVCVESKHRGMSERKYTAFLLIHGLLHLKGMQHSATMERHEQKMLERFSIR